MWILVQYWLKTLRFLVFGGFLAELYLGAGYSGCLPEKK